MDPSARPLSERERFRFAALLVEGLPFDWADRIWDLWDTDPWALLETAQASGALHTRVLS